MNGAYVRYMTKKLSDHVAAGIAEIDHRSVIRGATADVEISVTYLILLMLSGLVALLGLLMNSVAVVIGAMMISPLMGPILSFGLAFTLGDLALARKGMRNIVLSVCLIVAVTAVVTVISPLKESTMEILTRSRPNIYDLFIAFLSGTAGTISLCTKKNYLITTAGVAVATAVIPPLSVVGYGLGSSHPLIAAGGFLLFFTNFVAIILSADLVFFLCKFRASEVEGSTYTARKRFLILGTVLVLISIPLVYTLVTELERVKLGKRVESILREHLDRKDVSHVTGFTLSEKGGTLKVDVSVKTVKLLEEPLEKRTELALAAATGRKVTMGLEQVLVTSGAVEPKPSPLLPVSPVLPPPAARPETMASLSEVAAKLLGEIRAQVETMTAPFPVHSVRVQLGERGGPALLIVTIGRDYPFSDDERELLRRMVEARLRVPVTLDLERDAFLPPLTFDNKGNLAKESIDALAVVKKLPGGTAAFRFLVRAPGREGMERASTVRRYLVQGLKVAPENIAIRTTKRGAPALPQSVTLSVARP